MWRFWWRQIVRYALQHRFLALINVLSVALGVAIYLAIQVTNRSAQDSFAAGVDVVAGRAHLEAKGDIDDSLLPQLQSIEGVKAATPLVESVLVLPDFPGEYLHLVGVDPFTNREFQTLHVLDLEGESLDRWFGDARAISITQSFARAHGLKVGDSLKVEIGEKQVVMTIAFLLEVERADSHFAAMDIGWAQELLEKAGTLSTVLFRVDDQTNPEPAANRIRKLVPANVVVEPPSERSAQVAKMLAGFQLNLTALSLVSLLVGVFLIYNTITASVVRRQTEIGVLRSIGTSPGQVRWLFLGEAILYGLSGSVLGIAGGLLLAHSLLKVVATTISNLYVLTSIERVYIPWDQIVVGFVLALTATLLGAWVPAESAARLPPLRALNLGFLIERIERPPPACLAWSGLAAGVALVSGFTALASNIRPAAFLCALSSLVAFCLLTPFLTYGFGKVVSGRFHREYLVHLAAQNLVRSLFRNAITIAALASAVAMLVSISIMIFSLRSAVDGWINRRLVADLFVTPADNETVGFQSFVSPDLLSYLEQLPQVEALDTYRDDQVQLFGETVALGVVKGSSRNRPQFVGGGDSEKLKRWHDQDTVIASEPLARRFHLREGQTLDLPTPAGIARFVIAGIFYDYTRDAGLVLMQRSSFEKYWRDPRIHSVAVYLKTGINNERVVEQIRQDYPRAGAYAIHSNRALRVEVERIFNQTFAVTYLLRGISMAVAVIGIALNLIVLVKERERELAVLRALGSSARQINLLVLLEALFLGILAVGIGLVAGSALAFVLTEVINKTFFGWTIPLQIPLEQLVSVPLVLLPIAVLAGLVPAIQAGRGSIVEAIRI
jgi:putative ABC transport system permease protein